MVDRLKTLLDIYTFLNSLRRENYLNLAVRIIQILVNRCSKIVLIINNHYFFRLKSFSEKFLTHLRILIKDVTLIEVVHRNIVEVFYYASHSKCAIYTQNISLGNWRNFHILNGSYIRKTRVIAKFGDLLIYKHLKINSLTLLKFTLSSATANRKRVAFFTLRNFRVFTPNKKCEPFSFNKSLKECAGIKRCSSRLFGRYVILIYPLKFLFLIERHIFLKFLTNCYLASSITSLGTNKSDSIVTNLNFVGISSKCDHFAEPKLLRRTNITKYKMRFRRIFIVQRFNNFRLYFRS